MQEFSRNDIANFAKKITGTLTFHDQSFDIIYRLDENIEPDNWVVWANGTVRIGQQKYCVGGGWIEQDRTVADYSRPEIGDIEYLADALGISDDDEDEMDALYDALCASLPPEWPEAAIIA